MHSVLVKREHAQACLTLCIPMDCSLLGFPVHGISQARILEWVAVSFSRDLCDPRIEPKSPVFGRRVLYHGAIWEASEEIG